MATTYLTRTQSNTGSETKGTFSAWIKRSKLGSIQVLFSSKASSEFFAIEFDASDKFQANLQINGTDYLNLKTTRVLRDTSAWYNLVVAIDSTDSTQADRVKMYVNGVRETSFSTNLNNVSSSLNMRINGSSQNPFIGSFEPTSAQDFDGSMSHIHWVDGTAYPASAFGSTDSTTGEWKINTSPSVTYGTNGFFILKDGNTITDSSPNSNNFSLGGGTLTKTEDCPSNNFATWNASDRWLGNTAGNGDFLRNGNTYFRTTSDSQKALVRSTIGVTSGKYYCEMKVTQIERTWVGICNKQIFTSSSEWWTQSNNNGLYWYGNGTAMYDAQNNSGNAYGGFVNNDIVMIALDMDNKALYFGKNGTWLNSGDPTSGSSKTGSVTEYSTLTNASYALENYEEVYFMAGEPSTAGIGQVYANFGNGYFGTTAVSSAGTNASGNGIFEYDVPAGYTALSTKGINL